MRKPNPKQPFPPPPHPPKPKLNCGAQHFFSESLNYGDNLTVFNDYYVYFKIKVWLQIIIYVSLNVVCTDTLQEWAVGVLEKKGGHLKLF